MRRVHCTLKQFEELKHQVRKMKLPDHIILDWYKDIYKPNEGYISTVHAEIYPHEFKKMSHDLVWIGSSVGDVVTPRTGVIFL